MLEICTIGFTKHTAQRFFETISSEAIEQVIDVRLNNSGQLAGFAKRDDLRYFLETICNADYLHEPELLAPTPELFKAYRSGGLTWDEYEIQYRELIDGRKIHCELTPEQFAPRTALLCSEHTADSCHRRLIVEHLDQHWRDVSAVHLPRSEHP